MKFPNSGIFFIFVLIILLQKKISAYFSVKLDSKRTHRHFNSSNLQDPQILLEDYSNDENKIILTPNHRKHDLINQVPREESFKNEILNFLTDQNNLAVVKITNYNNVQYYGKIYVGSNKQIFSVIFDTGSNLLWLSSKDCTSCRNYTQKFAYDESITYNNLYNNKNITYAIGFVDGNYVQDNIYTGKKYNPDSQNQPNYYMGIEAFKFLLVNHEEYLDGTVADGVMGIGFDYQNDYSTSFIYMLYLSGQITSPVFYFYLSDSRLNSRLYIGDIKKENPYLENKFKRMNYCDVSSTARYWQCDLVNFELKENIPDPDYQNYQSNLNKPEGIAEIPSIRNNTTITYFSSSKVIFDTGTSFLVIPINDFLNVAQVLSKNALDHKCGVTLSLQYICKCRSPQDFDNIYLNLKSSGVSSNKLEIITENLIDYYPTLEFQCRFQILIDLLLGDYWILGDSVLRDSLVSFDMQERKIGWIQKFIKMDDSIFESGTNNNITTDKGGFVYHYFIVSLFIFGGILLIYLIWKCCYVGSQGVSHLRNENLI
jgi:hypothetical protein